MVLAIAICIVHVSCNWMFVGPPPYFLHAHISGGAAADLGVQLGTIPSIGPGTALQGPGLVGLVNGTASAMDTRFVRAAKTVGECLGRVKTLSERVNSASAFRESCSKLLGAAFACSLALQEVRAARLQQVVFGSPGGGTPTGRGC
jgi:hypothetical protein